MSDLLEVALAAHGGLDRWDGITSIDVARVDHRRDLVRQRHG
jgi:hypothetical protein